MGLFFCFLCCLMFLFLISGCSIECVVVGVIICMVSVFILC